MMYAEASSYHLQWINERPDDYSPNTRERLELGALLPGTVYVRATRVRRVIIEAYRDLFRSVDILVMPTGGATANRIGGPGPQPVTTGGDRMGPLIRFTGPFNVTGLPAISVPCGVTDGGLPVGIQFAARAFEDATLLRFAHAFERAVAPRMRRPSPASLVA